MRMRRMVMIWFLILFGRKFRIDSLLYPELCLKSQIRIDWQVSMKLDLKILSTTVGPPPKMMLWIVPSWMPGIGFLCCLCCQCQ